MDAARVKRAQPGSEALTGEGCFILVAICTSRFRREAYEDPEAQA